MSAWILVTIVVLIAGGAVVAALFGDDSPLRHPGLQKPEQPLRPRTLRSVSFRTRFRGYDPVEVDRWLAAAADAWEALAEVAGDELLTLADEELRLARSPDEDGLRHGLARLERTMQTGEPGSGEELQDGGSDPARVLDR